MNYAAGRCKTWFYLLDVFPQLSQNGRNLDYDILSAPTQSNIGQYLEPIRKPRAFDKSYVETNVDQNLLCLKMRRPNVSWE